MKMVSGQPRLRPPNSWLWILLVATGAALKLAGALQLSGDSRFHRHLLQEPTCPFSSLRQLVDASEDGTGLFACSYCTLSGCTLSCQSCKQPGSELPAGPSSLDLSSCDTLSTLSMSDGQLVCEAPPPPLLLVGDIQVTISHANENDNSTAERIPPSLSYAIVINQTETELGIQIKFELGDLAQEADLMNGDKVELAVAPASGSRRRRMQEGNEASGCVPPFCISPDSIRNISKLAGASGKDFVVNNRPVNITSIIMLATMCNVQPLISEQTLRNALFKPNQNQPSPYANLQHYYDVCSYRKVMFTPENNKVTTVNLPCSAPYQSGVNYDTANLCGDPELYGWQRDALTQAVSKLAISNATYYKRRVLLMPERAACQWAGLASVGCDVNCNTWLQQYDRWFELTTAFHELGHNIGLQHANRWIDGRNSEYDDFTDPMGSAYTDWATDQYGNKSMVCLSAPEAFKAGWMSPVRKFALSPYPDNSTIRTDLLPPNSAQRVVIPSMHTTDNNFLWINVSSLPDFKPSWPAWAAALPRANQLFVSYRVKQPQPGFDSGLVPELSNKIFIHSFNITQRSPPRPDPSAPEMKPSLIGILDTRPGRVMGGAMTVDTFFRLNYGPTPFNDGTQPGSTGINGIHISVVSTSSSQAVVNVCYFRYARESDAEGGCDNGSDDDCDGLIDAADPDCAGAVRSPPPPPVRSPPPPPVRSPPPPPPVRSPPPPPVRSPPPPPPVRSPPPPPTRSPPPPPLTRSPPPPPPTRSPPPPVRSPPPPPPVRSPRPPPPIRSPPPPPPIRSPPPPPRTRSPKLRRPPSPPKRRRPRTGRLQ